MRVIILALANTAINVLRDDSVQLTFQDMLYVSSLLGLIIVIEVDITQAIILMLQAIYLMTDQDPNTAESPELRTQDIFQKMDVNSDGVLSKEEFIQGCMNDETLFKLLSCSSPGGLPEDYQDEV